MMKYYKIIYLDCSNPKARKALYKKAAKILHLDEKPETEKLEKICKRIQSKYGISIAQLFKKENGKWFMSVEISRGSYVCFECLTKYEALLKYVLYAKQRYEDSKQ